MNITLIIAAVILIGSALIGFGRGLIKSIFSTFALIVAIVLAIQAMPYGTKFLKQTPIYTTINESIQETVDRQIQISTEGVSQQMEAIEQMDLPDFIKDMLKSNNNMEMYEALGINEFSGYISNYITCLILNGISVIIIFLILFITIRIIGCMLDLFRVCIMALSICGLPVLLLRSLQEPDGDRKSLLRSMIVSS